MVWLNSVIYWLINHYTDWTQTGVTSFGRKFDFHVVIYCNFGNFGESFIFADSIKRHICDVKIRYFVIIYLHK